MAAVADGSMALDIILGGIETVIVGDASDLYVRNAQGQATALEPLLETARRCLGEDDTVLDVGANIGLSTIGLARLVPRGRVFAFEPSSVNAASLRNNLSRNGVTNVVVIEAAVSDAAGRLQLIDAAENRAASYIDRDGHQANVDAVDLDTVAVRHGLTNVALIKIDVEGQEPWVMAGARALIEAQRPKIWMEFNAWCLMAFGRVHPVEFAVALFGAFDGQVARGSALIPVGDAVSFVHDNVVSDGCVTDVLLELREHHAIPSSLGGVSGASVTNALRLEAENVTLRRRCAELEQASAGLMASWSWRITGPLRALARVLGLGR